MKPEMIITVGVPASGKSRWAREYATAHPNVTITERDMLRARNHTSSGNLWGYKFSKAKEKQITDAQEEIIHDALDSGKTVIVADTNLNEGTRTRLHLIAFQYSVRVREEIFDVPLHQCIKWNAKRPDHVPESVLIRMELKMRKYLGKHVHDSSNPDGLPECVIVDLDGTVADMRGIRGPYDWANVGKDNVHKHVAEYLKMLYFHRRTIIFFSGRDSVCRPETEQWLKEQSINYKALYMRPEGSTVNDSILKEVMFDKYIKGEYHVSHIVDDRHAVVMKWCSMGFKVFDVGNRVSDF